MKKIRLLQVVVGVSLVFLGGWVSPRETHPSPEGTISVVCDKIYLNNKVYAELRYPRISKNKQEHTGLAIYYYPCCKEDWILPKGGMGLYLVEEDKMYSTVEDVYEEFRKIRQECWKPYRLFKNGKEWAPGKSTTAVTAYDIQITEDGRYVCYKIRGSDKLQSYRVKYGEDFLK